MVVRENVTEIEFFVGSFPVAMIKLSKVKEQLTVFLSRKFTEFALQFGTLEQIANGLL